MSRSVQQVLWSSKTICRRQCGSAFCGVLVLPHTSGPSLHRVRAQHISRPSPPVSSTRDGCPTPPQNRGSGRGCRRRSGRLESAVAALGEGNPSAKPLLAALKVARSKVKVPVSARARKRLVVANEELEKAVDKKNSCTSDVEATELRMARLLASVPTPMQQEPVAVAEARSYRRVDPRARCAQVRSSACGRPSGHVAASGAKRLTCAHFRGKSSPRARCAAGRIGPATCRGSFSVDVDIDRSRRFSYERTLQPSHVKVTNATYGLRAVRVGEAFPPRPSFGEVSEINAEMCCSQSGYVSFRRVVVGHDTGGQRGQCIRLDAKARRIQHSSVPQTFVALHGLQIDSLSWGWRQMRMRTIAGRCQFLLLRRVWSTLWNST